MASHEKSGPRLIVSLDTPEVAVAREIIHEVSHFGVRFKIGPELFLRAGPEWVEKIVRQGASIFLDLKFHDIPNTVEAACRNAAHLGVWMCNVHALGGAEMIRRARGGLEEASAASKKQRPLLLAVTLLTSHGEGALAEIGLSGPPAGHVLRLAQMAQDAGADGVVASAQEAALLREKLGKDFLIVTPGIRPAGAGADDQSRIATPEAALRAGASFLVVGRPITQAPKPAIAARLILQEMEKALV